MIEQIKNDGFYFPTKMHNLIKKIWNNEILLWSNVFTCAERFREKSY